MLSPQLLGGLLARMEQRKRQRDRSMVADIDTRVWIIDLDHGGEMDFVLVEPSRAKPNLRFISILSPFGEALFGARVGDMVHPRFLGHEYSVLIKRVEPWQESES
ncbi:GreA/GreB family elongation factor [Alloalcanivorax gelatiniphagus]|nr:GreA/GreB family elongation factor [Alloalcanivorax gelatiniphagus]|tara:strand:- start:1971 stop:2285 length:315 start_codon:yes stop_codon:yes gene_type:complete